MKQGNLFGQEFAPKVDSKYTSKIKAPIYEPKNIKPHILELYDNSKTKRLIQQINNANISEEDKLFLKHAAQRHTVFNYSKIADYYAHSSKEVQQLMEHSALIIIDFEDAIQYAYAKLSEDIVQTYIKDTGNDI